jgi:hypothetical protein
LIEYVCQDILNVIRFGVLIGYKVRRKIAMLLETNVQGTLRFGTTVQPIGLPRET